MMQSPVMGDQGGFSSKALNMMKKMGYEEGKGLGKDLQGTAEALDLQSNTNTTGLAYQAPPKHGLYSCRGCNKVFNHIAQVNSHMYTKQHQKLHYNPSSPSGFACLQCDMHFLDLQQIVLHDLNVQHNKMIPQNNSYRCEICNIAANSQSQWAQHLNGTYHMEQMKKQALQMCETGFKAAQPQQDLMGSFAADDHNEKDTDTSFLRDTFAGLGSGDTNEDEESEEIQHEQTMEQDLPSSSPNLINFPALNTLYSSPTPISLSISSFSCTLCNVPCNSQGQLQAHLNSKGHLSKITPQQDFCCVTCSLKFNSATQLNAHLAGKKHQDFAARESLVADFVPQIQELSCHVCNMVFNSASQKQAHESGRAHANKMYNLGYYQPPPAAPY